jgi:hypothetical protein
MTAIPIQETKMPNSRRRIKAGKLSSMRDEISSKLSSFSDSVFKTVEYRSSLDPTPDGFPTNTRYGPRGGASKPHSDGCEAGDECNCGATVDSSTSTERAALRRIDGHISDSQQRACERIDQSFRTIWREIDAAERAWDVILNTSDAIREFHFHSSEAVCQACLRDDVPNIGNDRIKAGYCWNCYQAWLRTDKGNGRQDRVTFESSRRVLRVVDGSAERRTGYEVDELDELRGNGTLPGA